MTGMWLIGVGHLISEAYLTLPRRRRCRWCMYVRVPSKAHPSTIRARDDEQRVITRSGCTSSIVSDDERGISERRFVRLIDSCI